MNTTARHPTFVYLTLALLLTLTACGPKSKPPVTLPPAEIKYENEVATPTVTIPEATSKGAAKYQPVAKKIINSSTGKAPVEIILGEAVLRDPKISYSSVDRKMIITGNVILLNDHQEKITGKKFSLVGLHDINQNIFILKENAADTEQKLRISAQANCLNMNEQSLTDCNHVMVDVFIFYNNKYYTEQIELNRQRPEIVNPTPPPPAGPVITPTPVPAPELKSEEQAVQNENEDHTTAQQSEANDESISGRYQGGAETIDLDMLFPKEENESVAPAPAPQAAKEKNVSPDLIQTKSGDVRPVNQALGFPDKGSLRNATSILDRQQLNKKVFFEVVAPARKKHFATFDMAEIITRSGEQLNKQYSKILYVSNLSALNGGKLTQHASHQNGLDVDLAYPTDLAHLKFPLVVRMKTNEYFPNNYSAEKTYNLLKFIFMQKDIMVDRIFIDQKIKKELCLYAISQNELTGKYKDAVIGMFENLQHVAGHGDHFHLRIKCSKLDPACRGRIYKKMESCGGKS